MHVHDAQILRGAAVPTAVAGIVLAVLCGVLAGGKGLLGAVFGVVVVSVFFTTGIVVLDWVSRVNSYLLMNAALLTYLIKILLLAVLLMLFKDTTAFDTKAFALAIVVSTLVWVGAQTRAFSKLKILYVEPDRKL